MTNTTPSRAWAYALAGATIGAATALGVAVLAASSLPLGRSGSGSGSAGENSAGRSRFHSNKVKVASKASDKANETIRKEQLSRGYLFFGEEGQEKIDGAYVVVVGVGGVGSHAAHMLARSGCRRVRMIDFDVVTLSSLNRHAVATRDDVTRFKVDACAEHFADFMPGCVLEPLREMFTGAHADALLLGPGKL